MKKDTPEEESSLLYEELINVFKDRDWLVVLKDFDIAYTVKFVSIV
jgi:hypothetical protein